MLLQQPVAQGVGEVEVSHPARPRPLPDQSLDDRHVHVGIVDAGVPLVAGGGPAAVRATAAAASSVAAAAAAVVTVLSSVPTIAATASASVIPRWTVVKFGGIKVGVPIVDFVVVPTTSTTITAAGEP